VAVFEGGHTLPPASVALDAIEWLELQAMKSGRKAPDQALIDRLFDKRQREVSAAESATATVRLLTNLVDDFKGLRDVAAAASRAAGGSGKPAFVPLSEATKNIGYYAEALAVNQHVDSRKAERVLGWRTKHAGFLDEAATFYEAWKASKG